MLKLVRNPYSNYSIPHAAAWKEKVRPYTEALVMYGEARRQGAATAPLPGGSMPRSYP